MILTKSDLKGKTFLEGGRGERRYNCVYCDDTGSHLYVNVAKGLFHCFKCEVSGVVAKDQQNLDNIDWDKIEGIVKSYQQAESPLNKWMNKAERVKSLPRCSDISLTDPDARPYWEYLLSRGLFPQEIADNRLRYSLDKKGLYSNCVIFSNLLEDYFVCRKIDGSQPKYINAPWPKGDALYCPIAENSSSVVICEGVFDALKIARVNKVFSLLGKRATREQLRAIAGVKEHVSHFTIFLDPDAFSFAVRLKLELKEFVGHFPIFIVKHSDRDPGDSTTEEIKEVLEECVSTKMQ